MPKPKTMHTVTLDPEQTARLGALLDQRGWEPFEVPHSVFARRAPNVNVVAYKSGKVVIAGKGAEEFVLNVLETEVTGEPRLGYEEVSHPEWFETHAGLDESGKGDLFGPLVTACVIAGGEAVSQWREAGVRDSKTVSSDAAIWDLERKVRRAPGVTVKVIFTGMEKYNALYRRFGANLNNLLAWYHATGLADALALNTAADGEAPAWGLLDQFCKTPLTQRELKKRKLKFDLRMRTRAEDDPVVAAASIVARAVFAREMGRLSRLAGETLPRGCGAEAKAAGFRLVEKFGAERFGEFAKLHFKTAFECRGLPVPERPEHWASLRSRRR